MMIVMCAAFNEQLTSVNYCRGWAGSWHHGQCQSWSAHHQIVSSCQQNPHIGLSTNLILNLVWRLINGLGHLGIGGHSIKQIRKSLPELLIGQYVLLIGHLRCRRQVRGRRGRPGWARAGPRCRRRRCRRWVWASPGTRSWGHTRQCHTDLEGEGAPGGMLRVRHHRHVAPLHGEAVRERQHRDRGGVGPGGVKLEHNK